MRLPWTSESLPSSRVAVRTERQSVGWLLLSLLSLILVVINVFSLAESG